MLNDSPASSKICALRVASSLSTCWDWLPSAWASMRTSAFAPASRNVFTMRFAAGTSGDKQQARKYFDMAFSAADEVWDARTPETDAAAVVQEISEAAAQVDSLNALTRAQKLHDSSAQAIGMLAVARVVGSNGVTR